MKIAKTISILYLAVTTIFLVGCKSSALEDVEITDFNLIRATYNIYIEKETNASTIKTIEVIIEDKNYHKFEIKGGTVTVNGIRMTYDNSDLVRRYKTDKLSIKSNISYTFVITLANGDTATSVLTTDEIDFDGLSYAPQLIQGQDYTVSWSNKGTNMGAKFWLYDTPEFSSLHEVFDEVINDNGSVTLVGSSTESSKYPDVTNSGFKLTRTGTSIVSDKFRSASAAVYSSYFVEGIPVK